MQLAIKNFVSNGLGYSAFLLSFFLLFSIKLANISLIVFYVFCVIGYFVNKPITSPKGIGLLKFSVLLLLSSLIISVMEGIEFEFILKGLGRRIAFVLTPLAFLLLSKRSIALVKDKALKGLLLGILVSSVFLLSNILHEYYLTRELFSINKDLFNFYHTNFYFTRVLDIHPSYYGMFVITGLATVYFYKGFKSYYLNAIFVILATIVLLFLNARIILFLFVILNMIYLIRYFYLKTQRILKAFLLSMGVFFALGVLLFTITKNTYAYQRVFSKTLWEFSRGIDTIYNSKNSEEPRMARWYAALNVIKKKPVLGYGVFKETETLMLEYDALNMKSSYVNRYNAHNQFLGFAIEGGFFSALALLFFICVNLFISIKYKDLVFFLFVLSVFSICLVENYLVRNAGIIFTAFFASIFLFDTSENER
jgi:O-antigen ligase